MKTPNPSLQKKSAARMAAVQCRYRRYMTDEQHPVDEQVAQLKKQLKDNKSEQKLLVGVAMEPDYALLKRILNGVEEWQDAIHERIDDSLAKGWTRARMGALLIGILECGIFELLFDKDLGARIVADEYTRLARHFVADDEVDFVHAVLSALSRRERDGESRGESPHPDPLPEGEGV